jgi:hypothetical protein
VICISTVAEVAITFSQLPGPTTGSVSVRSSGPSVSTFEGEAGEGRFRISQPFTPKFGSMVLKFVFRGRLLRSTQRVLIYTDTLPMTGKRRAAVGLAIKKSCQAELKVPFESFHHRAESNAWIQVTDYCCWGVFRKWESSDTRTYDLLRPRLAATEINRWRRWRPGSCGKEEMAHSSGW